MQLRASDPEEIRLNMTSMIDIVFQLLVFFIMTFKVVVNEGDFSIKMPRATETPDDIISEIPDLIRVQLLAGDNGGISAIFVDDNPLAQDDIYGNLTREIELKLTGEGDLESDQEETEVEFDIDRNLKYSYTVQAITAVSGKVEPGGVKKLIKKIKFKDKKQDSL